VPARSVVNRAVPERVEVAAAGGGLPVRAHQVVMVLPPHGKQRRDFQGRPAGVQRRNQRLHDGDGAVPGARVAPALEVVGRGNVPQAEARRLVVVRGKVPVNATLASAPAKSRSPERRRRVAASITSASTLPAFMSATRARDRRGSGRHLFGRLGVLDGAPRVAERQLIAWQTAWTSRPGSVRPSPGRAPVREQVLGTA